MWQHCWNSWLQKSYNQQRGSFALPLGLLSEANPESKSTQGNHSAPERAKERGGPPSPGPPADTTESECDHLGSPLHCSSSQHSPASHPNTPDNFSTSCILILENFLQSRLVSQLKIANIAKQNCSDSWVWSSLIKSTWPFSICNHSYPFTVHFIPNQGAEASTSALVEGGQVEDKGDNAMCLQLSPTALKFAKILPFGCCKDWYPCHKTLLCPIPSPLFPGPYAHSEVDPSGQFLSK